MKKRLFIAGVLIFAVFVNVLLAAISVNGTPGIFSNGMNQTTQTLSMTVGAASDKLMLGGYGVAAGATPAQFTFNGDTLTQLEEIQTGAASSAGIWYRKEPDVATGDLVVTWAGASISGLGGLALNGVDQTSTFRDTDETQSSAATSLTRTLTTVAGDVVFYVVHAYNPGSTPGALDHDDGSVTGEVEIGEADSNGDGQTLVGCSYVVATGTSTEVTYSWANSSRAAMVATAVQPTPGTSSVVPVFRRRRN